MRLIFVSGLSGAGKSVALNALEDTGFYCIDNMPAAMLAPLISHAVRSKDRVYDRMAIGLDARSADQEIGGVPATIDGGCASTCASNDDCSGGGKVCINEGGCRTCRAERDHQCTCHEHVRHGATLHERGTHEAGEALDDQITGDGEVLGEQVDVGPAQIQQAGRVVIAHGADQVDVGGHQRGVVTRGERPGDTVRRQDAEGPDLDRHALRQRGGEVDPVQLGELGGVLGQQGGAPRLDATEVACGVATIGRSCDGPHAELVPAPVLAQECCHPLRQPLAGGVEDLGRVL
jgi:hypothetical protein